MGNLTQLLRDNSGVNINSSLTRKLERNDSCTQSRENLNDTSSMSQTSGNAKDSSQRQKKQQLILK